MSENVEMDSGKTITTHGRIMHYAEGYLCDKCHRFLGYARDCNYWPRECPTCTTHAREFESLRASMREAVKALEMDGITSAQAVLEKALGSEVTE